MADIWSSFNTVTCSLPSTRRTCGSLNNDYGKPTHTQVLLPIGHSVISVSHDIEYRIHKEELSNKSPLGLSLSLILLISGDVELNPGLADSSMYPGAICQLGVNWLCDAVACNTCDVWLHKACASMDSTTYANIGDKEWKCYHCESVNHSSFLYHAFNLNVSNSFAPLAGIPGDDSIFMYSVSSPSSPFHPRGHSSPAVSEPGIPWKPRSHVSSSCSTQSFSTSDITLGKVRNNIRIAVMNGISV